TSVKGLFMRMRVCRRDQWMARLRLLGALVFAAGATLYATAPVLMAQRAQRARVPLNTTFASGFCDALHGWMTGPLPVLAGATQDARFPMFPSVLRKTPYFPNFMK